MATGQCLYHTLVQQVHVPVTLGEYNSQIIGIVPRKFNTVEMPIVR